MKKVGILVCALAALLVVAYTSKEKLKIGAFNIQVFGGKKMKNTKVVEILKKIVLRYDVVLIQEIRDESERTIPDFLALVNKGGGKYKDKTSIRLGRTASKEQYAFLYRADKLKVIGSYQYPNHHDYFERPPYSVRFETIGNGQDFFLMGIHVKPKDALNEINYLRNAFWKAAGYFGNERGVIMGDLNAGCGYLSEKEYENLYLKKDYNFEWLLGYDADTTVADKNCCPYDRFIVHKSLVKSVGVGKVYNFKEEHGLTLEEAKKVSDHFPIEFELELSDTTGSRSSSSSKVTLTQAAAGLVVMAIIRCYN